MQEPNNNNELRDQILGGEYQSKERPGMINPDEQMNWSLGLAAEQSEMIEVMTIDNDGNAVRKGLITALFDLSQGTEVEDAKQEGEITLGYKEGDKEIRISIAPAANGAVVPSHAFEVPAIPAAPVAAEGYEAYGAAEDCDGERTGFKTKAAVKGDWTVYVNGVESGFVKNGFSIDLDRAPEASSDVRFIGHFSSIEVRISNGEEHIAILKQLGEDVTKKYEAKIDQLKTTADELSDEKTDTEEALAAKKSEVSEFKQSYLKHREEMESGETVSDVDAAVKAAVETLRTLEEAEIAEKALTGDLENYVTMIAENDNALLESNSNKLAFDSELTKNVDKTQDALEKAREDKKGWDDFGADEA